VAVVGEAIKKSRGENRIAEDLTPARELQVGGDEHGARLVALGEELKEERSSRSESQVSKLI
jgi:hypothetical protein